MEEKETPDTKSEQYFNEQIDKIIPKQKPVDQRSFLQRNKKLLISLGIILAVLIFAAGFYVNWGVMHVYNMINAPTSLPTSSLTPAPTIDKTVTPTQTFCNTNADCGNGYRCMTVGPIIANQPLHKVCVKEGTAVPL